MSILRSISLPVYLPVCLLAALAPNFAPPLQAAGVTYLAGDVFAGTGNGQIKQFHSDGTLVNTLNTGAGVTEDTGMAFDSAGNLYATVFEANNIYKFDNSGNLIGPFGSGYNEHPNSVVFDKSNNAYVGLADGTGQVLKFNSAGTMVNAYSPALEVRGTNWIDLAADQCTLRYTSQGSIIHSFNVCTNTQLPDFAAGLTGPCLRAPHSSQRRRTRGLHQPDLPDQQRGRGHPDLHPARNLSPLRAKPRSGQPNLLDRRPADRSRLSRGHHHRSHRQTVQRRHLRIPRRPRHLRPDHCCRQRPQLHADADRQRTSQTDHDHHAGHRLGAQNHHRHQLGQLDHHHPLLRLRRHHPGDCSGD